MSKYRYMKDVKSPTRSQSLVVLSKGCGVLRDGSLKGVGRFSGLVTVSLKELYNSNICVGLVITSEVDTHRPINFFCRFCRFLEPSKVEISRGERAA